MSSKKRIRPPRPAERKIIAPPVAANRSFEWKPVLFLLALLAATAAAYHPAWHGTALWDDAGHITRSDLRPASGLERIWFEVGATQQYYPVAHTAFWVLYHAFGDNTFGYHLVNISLHALSAFLLALILRKLAVPGAVLAAFIFALHPVQVESVAWISELKNVLSGVFYLTAALSYLRFDRTRRLDVYALAMGLFVLALFSKTVTATLPIGMLIVLWWQRGTLDWKNDVRPLAPFVLLGLGAGLVTAWFERTKIGAEGAGFDLTIIERCLIAGRATVFYAAKLVWPTNLIFVYPRWNVSQGEWWQYLFPIAIVALLIVLWMWRGRSRAPLAATLFFGVTLSPALGFINVFPFKYSFVADHFQYLASIGLITLGSAALTLAARRWTTMAAPMVTSVLVVALGAPLAAMTWRQSHQYVDMTTLFRTTISRNPTCWMAYTNLASVELVGSTDLVPDAIMNLQKALALNPENSQAHINMGIAMEKTGNTPEAMREFEEGVRQAPGFAIAHYNLGVGSLHAGRFADAERELETAIRLSPNYAAAENKLGSTLQHLGHLNEAATHIKIALEIDPQVPEAHYNLGVVLHQQNHLDDAIAEYREAVRLAGEAGFPEAHQSLGIALQAENRPDEAMVEYREALRLKASDPGAHVTFGGVLEERGQFDAAEAEYNTALRLDPNSASAHNSLGTLWLRSGRSQDGLAQIAEAVRLQPGSAPMHNSMGTALASLGRLQDAAVYFHEAVQLQPDYAPAHLNLGSVMQGMGRLEDAVAEYTEGLKYDPTSAPAHNSLGVALASLGRFQDAVVQFQEAVRLDPASPNARANLDRATAMLNRGK